MTEEEIKAALRVKADYIDGKPGYLCALCQTITDATNIVWEVDFQSLEPPRSLCKPCSGSKIP